MCDAWPCDAHRHLLADIIGPHHGLLASAGLRVVLSELVNQTVARPVCCCQLLESRLQLSCDGYPEAWKVDSHSGLGTLLRVLRVLVRFQAPVQHASRAHQSFSGSTLSTLSGLIVSSFGLRPSFAAKRFWCLGLGVGSSDPWKLFQSLEK